MSLTLYSKTNVRLAHVFLFFGATNLSPNQQKLITTTLLVSRVSEPHVRTVYKWNIAVSMVFFAHAIFLIS
jgi:hypothetical protein